MINGKKKGKAGELEVVRLCKAEGYDVHWVRKNRVEDLKKAREYLDMLIRDVEENGGKE